MQATATKRIAERYVGPLNEWQTAHAIAAVRANVSELASAAEALAAAGIYSKSCALSILAVEESQKVSMLLSLLYADTPDEQREIWKEFRNHRKKHTNIGIDIASSAVVEGTIAPEAAAVALKAKEGPDPDNLEELKQALIYSDCTMDAQGLPQWSNPVDISEHAEADAKRLLESARDAAAHLYPFSEEELRVWKRHMAPVRRSSLKEQLEHMKKCEAELQQLGLSIPKRLQKL
jgi:AbiV family abortive infection protein